MTRLLFLRASALCLVLLLPALLLHAQDYFDGESFDSAVLMLQSDDAETRMQAIQPIAESADPRAFSVLAKAARDVDPLVRGQVMIGLGQLGDMRALRVLKAATRDEHVLVSTQAVEAMGALQHRDAVSVLIGILRDRKSPVRNAAAFALGEQQDARALRALLALREDPDPVLRSSILRALCFPDDEATRAPRLEAMRTMLHDGDLAVRCVAIDALVEMEDRESLPVFHALFAGENAEIRAAALRALLQFGEESEIMSAALTDADITVRVQAVRFLADNGGEERLALLAPLGRHDEVEIRAAVYRALAVRVEEDSTTLPTELQAQVRALILPGLTDADEEIRNHAMTLAASYPDVQFIEPLIELLLQPLDTRFVGDHYTLLMMPMRALSAINHPQVFDKLTARLPALRGEARDTLTRALGSLNDPRVDALFAQLLRDAGSREVKQSLLEALNSKMSPQRAATLTLFLHDDDEDIQQRAAYKLTELEETGWQALYAALDHPNVRVRNNVLRIFLDHGYFLEGWREEAQRSANSSVRLAMYFWLLSQDEPQAVAGLLALLSDENPRVRLESAQLLLDRALAVGDVRVTEALATLLTVNDGEYALRAATLLAKTGDARAIPVLAAAIFVEVTPDDDAYYERNQYIAALLNIRQSQVLDYAPELLESGAEMYYRIIPALLSWQDERGTELLLEHLAQTTSSARVLALLSQSDEDEDEDEAPALERTVLQSIRLQRLEYPAPLLRALADPRPEMRALMGYLLGESGQTHLLPVLLPLLHDPDALVRLMACPAFERAADVRAMPLLVERLQQDGGEIGDYAARALGAIGDRRALPALLTAWHEGNDRVLPALLYFKDARVAEALLDIVAGTRLPRALPQALQALALQALALLADEETMSPALRARVLRALTRIARDDRHPQQQDAVLALTAYGDTRVMGALLTMAREGNPGEVQQAMASIPLMRDPAMIAALAGAYAVRHGFLPTNTIAQLRLHSSHPDIAALLAEYAPPPAGEKSTGDLLRALRNSNSPIEEEAIRVRDGRLFFYEREASAALLSRLQASPEHAAEMLNPLLALVRTGTGGKRLDAIQLLGFFADAKSEQFLMSALRVKGKGIRIATVLALGERRPPAALPSIRALADDSDVAVRAAVAVTLGKYGAPEDFDLLQRVLEEKNPLVAGHAMLGLGLMGEARAVDVLARYLQEGWREAAIALGGLNDDRVTPLLIASLENPRTRPQVSNVYNEYGEPRYSYRHPSSGMASSGRDAESMRQSLLRALRGQGDAAAVEAIIGALEFGSPQERALAAELLGELGDRRAIPALIEALDRFCDSFPLLVMGRGAELSEIEFPEAAYLEEQVPRGHEGVEVKALVPSGNLHARAVALKALRAISGEGFSANAAQWRDWWQKQPDAVR